MKAMRYERKFVAPDASLSDILPIIKSHPAHFCQLYERRRVNNIYFDSTSLAHYEAHVAGVGSRRKVRIRWYGENTRFMDRPTLELKEKRGQVGYKQLFPLLPASVDDALSPQWWQLPFANKRIPARIRTEIQGLIATVGNSYYRTYWQSGDKKFRLTVDTNLQFTRLGPAGNLHPTTIFRGIIVELKYDAAEDHLAPAISSKFPWPLVRSSKYVSAVEHAR